MNYIKKISFKNYRNISNDIEGELELVFPTKNQIGLNIIVGQNNIGKSSIFKYLSGINIPNQHLDDSKNGSDGIEIKYTLTDDSIYNDSYYIMGNYYVIPSEAQNAAISGENTGIIPQQVFDSMAQKFSKPEATNLAISAIYGYLFHNNKPLADKIIDTTNKIIGADIKIRYNRIQQTSALQYSNDIRTLDISQTSASFWRVFLIIAIFELNLEKGIIIDEPENLLNPAVQKALFKYIVKQSEERQVIIITHSPEFIDLSSIERGAQVVRCKLAHEKLTYKLFNKNIENFDKIIKLFSQTKNLHYFDYEAKKFLFYQNILFVEGQEDANILRKFIRDNNIDSQLEIFGYGSGGAENIPILLKFAIGMGYNVGAIFDADKKQLYSSIISDIPDLSNKIEILATDDIRDKYEVDWDKIKDEILVHKALSSGIKKIKKLYKIGLFDENLDIKKEVIINNATIIPEAYLKEILTSLSFYIVNQISVKVL